MTACRQCDFPDHLCGCDTQPGQQEPVAVYGYCPECGAEGVSRERRADGNDCCANGHRYPSRTSNKTPQRKPLTKEQIESGRRAPWGVNLDAFTAGVRFAEAHHGIKEK